MRKYLPLVVASVIGGAISVAIYSNLTNKQTTYVQSDTTLQGARPMQVSYQGMVDFTAAASATVDAVVHVKIRSQYSVFENPIYDFLFGRSNYQQEMPVVAAGSGVIISRDGYIVTNNHVVEGADALDVTLDDNRTFTAKVIGTDPTTDIALIKIEGDNFPFIAWGDSDNLKVGEWVLAIGNPFNLASTVTAGIVSAKARNLNINNRKTAIESFIQTDAAVNPGNSGGALVNVAGELVGVITAIASPTGSFTGYSFAVPERIARKVVSDLMEYGAVQRAYIGISINEVTSETAQKNGVTSLKGVYVSAISDGGAAQEAGIKNGDVILKMNDIEVNTVAELQEQIGRYRPGQQVNVTVLRGDKTHDMKLTLRNIDGGTSLQKSNLPTEFFGAKLQTVSQQLANYLRIRGGVEVVLIADGKFKQAGVREGFIITSVNRQLVRSVDELKAILSNSKGGIYIEGVYPNGKSAYYAFGI